jgi:hypothetical protein
MQSCFGATTKQCSLNASTNGKVTILKGHQISAKSREFISLLHGVSVKSFNAIHTLIQLVDIPLVYKA